MNNNSWDDPKIYKRKAKPIKAWLVKLTYKEFKIFARKWEAELYVKHHPYIIKGITQVLITPLTN